MKITLNDQVTIAGSNIGGADTQNDATLNLTSVGATTFSNVAQASTSGNGSGAIFTISTMAAITVASTLLVDLDMNQMIPLPCQLASAAPAQRMI